MKTRTIRRVSLVLIVILSLMSILVLNACIKAESIQPIEIEKQDASVVIENNTVVVTYSSVHMPNIEGKFLIDYLNILEGKELLAFDAPTGFIKSINGIEPPTNSYWMVFTDDADSSNAEWGTFDWEGKTYNSASLGITDLPVKANATYIFTIITF